MPEFSTNNRLQSMAAWLILIQTSFKEKNSLETFTILWKKINKIELSPFTILPIVSLYIN